MPPCLENAQFVALARAEPDLGFLLFLSACQRLKPPRKEQRFETDIARGKLGSSGSEIQTTFHSRLVARNHQISDCFLFIGGLFVDSDSSLEVLHRGFMLCPVLRV